MKISTINVLFLLFSIFSSFTFSADYSENKINELAEIYSKSAKYKDMTISPDGKYIATTYMDSNGVSYVVTLHRENMQPIYGSALDGRDKPGQITWLNNTRLMVNVLSSHPWSEQSFLKTRIMFNVDGSKPKKLSGTPAIVNLLPDDDEHILVAGYNTGDVLGRASYTILYKVNIYKNLWKKIVKSPIRDGDFMANDDGGMLMTMGTVAKGGQKLL